MKLQELFEAKYKTLFHLTDVTATIDIIKSKRFKLSKSVGTSNVGDDRLSMSFATSSKSGYFTMMIGPDSVMLFFDKNKLAVESYKHEDGAKQLNSLGISGEEYEARLFGDTQYIPFDLSALLEVRILKTKERSRGTDFYTDEQLEVLTELCEKNNIPLKFVSTKAELKKAL